MIALLFASVVGFTPPSPAFSSAFLCRAPSVIDGDTLRCLDGTRVRLWGVLAPERKQPGGPEATSALGRLVVGQTLACVPLGTSFDRIVGRCWTLGIDPAAEMVRQGFAEPEAKYSGAFYAPAEQPKQ